MKHDYVKRTPKNNDNRPLRKSRDVHILASVITNSGKELDFVHQALVQAYWKDEDSFHHHWNEYVKDKNG